MADASTYRGNPRLPDCILSDHRNLEALQAQLDAAASESKTIQTMVTDTICLALRLRAVTDQQVLLPGLSDLLGDDQDVGKAQQQCEALLPMLDKLDAASGSEAMKLAKQAMSAALAYAQLLESGLLVKLQQTASHTQMTSLEKMRCDAMYALQL